MACLLVLVLVVAATGPPGKLTHAAAVTTSPAEAFWRTALPDAPMPEAIRELLLRHGTTTNAAAGNDVRRPTKYRDDDPPPMNFKYTDYRSSPRNQAAAAAPSAEVPMNRRAVAVVSGAPNTAPTVFFLEDEAVRVGGVLPVKQAPAADSSSSSPLRLYTVRSVRAVDGRRFVVCRREGDREAAGGPGNDCAVYGCRATGPSPARAYEVGVVGDRGETVAAAVVCRAGGGMMMPRRGSRARAAFSWLLDDVKPGGGGVGGGAAVCHAALDALVIPVMGSSPLV